MFSKLLPRIDTSANPRYDELQQILLDPDVTDEQHREARTEYNILMAEALQNAKTAVIKKVKAAAVLIGAVIIVGTIVVLAAGASEEEDSDEEPIEVDNT